MKFSKLHPQTQANIIMNDTPTNKAEARRQARAIANTQKYTHIVDQLILERAKKLSRSRWWPLYRFFLNKALGYKQAVTMVDEAGEMPASEAFEYVSKKLDLTIEVEGLENIPKEGSFLFALNHPTGIADGVAIYDMLKDVRPDMIFFANEDANRLNTHLSDMVIGVPWREEDKSRAKSRATLVETAKAFKQERAVVLFPSGRLAFMAEGKVLTEQEWLNSVAQLPKKFKCPIVPGYMVSRNSWLYYWLCKVNEELRDMTLFHELLNKKGQVFKIKVGKPIDPSELPEDSEKATHLLRRFVLEGVPNDIDWNTFLKNNVGYFINYVP